MIFHTASLQNHISVLSRVFVRFRRIPRHKLYRLKIETLKKDEDALPFYVDIDWCIGQSEQKEMLYTWKRFIYVIRFIKTYISGIKVNILSIQ